MVFEAEHEGLEVDVENLGGHIFRVFSCCRCSSKHTLFFYLTTTLWFTPHLAYEYITKNRDVVDESTHGI